MKLLFVILFLFLSPSLWAVEEVTPPTAAENDIDTEITNPKLRAESGSKSQWSIKSSIAYNGGNLLKPFSDLRPNYAGISSKDNRTNLAGTIAAAYRWGKSDTFRTGTGIIILTPFQKVEKVDVANPYLEYSRAMKVGKYQNIFDIYYTHMTQSAYTDAKYIGYLDVNHTALLKLDPTTWELGIVFDFYYTFFSDGKSSTDTLADPENGRSDYTFGIFPFAEYAFNDRYSFRTVFRFLTFDHYRNDEAMTFLRELYTQSVGVGIAVTRDVYLYPNIQFAPEYLSPERSNIGINATINIF